MGSNLQGAEKNGTTETPLVELHDLELALVGGGIGDPLAA
jgi:hypothetical protein